MAKDVNPESPDQPHWKAALTRRLTAEGRWLEAQRRKNALTNEGMSRDDAWLKILNEFPAFGSGDDSGVAGVEGPAGEDAGGDGEAKPEAAANAPTVSDRAPPAKRKRRDLKRDVQWVYDKFNQLKEKQIGVTKAPSPGAWALGQQAVANPQWFFKELAAKLLKDDESGGEGRFDDERDQFRLLDIFEREEAESRARKAEELQLEQMGSET